MKEPSSQAGRALQGGHLIYMSMAVQGREGKGREGGSQHRHVGDNDSEMQRHDIKIVTTLIESTTCLKAFSRQVHR